MSAGLCEWQVPFRIGLNGKAHAKTVLAKPCIIAQETDDLINYQVQVRI